MAEKRKLKVFLCHSRDDKAEVRQLYRRLVDDGFEAWLDEEKLIPGQDWDLEIRKAVRSTDVVMVCLSDSSVTKSGYAQKEIRFSLDVADEQPEGTIFIIPIRLDECQVPSRLNKWQWVNLFEKNGYKKLKVSLTHRANSMGLLIIPRVTRNIIEPEMVRILAGKFRMGSSTEQVLDSIKAVANKDINNIAKYRATENSEQRGLNSLRKPHIDTVYKNLVKTEKPQRNVTLAEYFIGKFPVTNQEYQSFIKEESYEPPSNWDGDQFPLNKGDHPVVNVSWIDAFVFCKWLGQKTNKLYRLPTEAEWEKAARGTDGRIWPWGNIFDENCANIMDSDIGDTTIVGQYSPKGDSPYGCADMVGNVWEWCADWYREDEYNNRHRSNVTNPFGPQKGIFRVSRGGSFAYSWMYATCTFRFMNYPDVHYGYQGFRVALSIED